MATSNSKKSSAPLTFDLPVSLISRIEATRKGHSLGSASEVVRLAMDNFNFDRCAPDTEPHRQISVRIPVGQRSMLKKLAKKKDTSVGELLRLALESLPVKPKAKARK